MSARNHELVERLRQHVDLGHAQRNQAFVRQVALACGAPGAAGPQAAGKSGSKHPWADAMSFYRFAGNKQIALADLRRSRAQTVLAPVPAGATVLLVHDVSTLDYCRHESKEDRRAVGDGKGRGYEYAACLAVDPQTGATWGMVHDTLISEHGPDDQDNMDYDYEPLFASFSKKEKEQIKANHRHQMAVHIRGTNPLLANFHVIDVADREFDDFFVFDQNSSPHRDFVIRSCATRNVQLPSSDWLTPELITPKYNGHPRAPGWVCANLDKVVKRVPLEPYKELPLDNRNRVVAPSMAKRWAALSLGAFRLRLYRDAKRNRRYLPTPHPLELNVVVIRELKPPPGQEPLEWILFTSLPVDTAEQRAYVGRIYELRWKIEDFFRLLKSGYRILFCRLDNAAKLARYLVVITLAALSILTLKRQAGLPPASALTPDDYQRLKQAMLQPDNPQIHLPLRLLALVAKKGGWLARRTDPIGPTILMRGMLHLLAVLTVSESEAALIAETERNPDVLHSLFCV